MQHLSGRVRLQSATSGPVPHWKGVGERVLGRYYFSVRAGEQLLLGPEGDELPDDAAAHELAFEIAREIMAMPSAYDPRAWRRRVLVVTDETGRDVLTLALSEVAEGDS